MNVSIVFDKLFKETKQVFLLGGFNINLLNNCYQPTNDFLDSLASNSSMVRTQCFSEKLRKIFLYIYIYSYFFWKNFSREYLVASKFLLEMPTFKENVIICAITIIKVRDLLFTLLQVIAILATKFQKWMNSHYSSW